MSDLEFIFKAANAIAACRYSPIVENLVAETVSREIHRISPYPLTMSVAWGRAAQYAAA